jgi:hypothetical protein
MNFDAVFDRLMGHEGAGARRRVAENLMEV